MTWPANKADMKTSPPDTIKLKFEYFLEIYKVSMSFNKLFFRREREQLQEERRKLMKAEQMDAYHQIHL